jgi:plasmid stabilization system protein ParE
MTFKVIADADAKRDWDEAVSWYENRHQGIGLRFDNALRIFLQSLAKNPERFLLSTRLAYKAKMPPPWPYSIYFTINTAHREVKILAIWHGARNPNELLRRIR